MSEPDVSTMSVDLLRRNLITCDYRGRAFKTKVLDELLRRTAQEPLEVLVECDEYLSSNKLNSIGSGSILHQKFRGLCR